jgi:hypothetical protein
MVFKNNIPLPTDNLSVSQGDLLGNNAQLDTSFGIDHYTFSDLTSNNGFHKKSTYPVGVDPAPVATTLITYSKNYTPNYTLAPADSQLFAITAGGGISQLTGNDADTEGWQWIGGVLLQWGQLTNATPGILGTFNSGSAQGTIVFKDRGTAMHGIPFPNNIFSVTSTLIASANAAGSASTITTIVNPTSTGFGYCFKSGTSTVTGIYWMAIGN